DGKKGNYTEEDLPEPVNKYGFQKVEAERIVLTLSPHNVVFRLPLMFGLSQVRETFFSNMLRKLSAGEPVELFTDEYRSICGVASVARGIIQLSDKAEGIVHLGGPQRLSRYEFGVIAANVFGLPKRLIKKTTHRNMPMAAPRPKDVSLNSQKAIHLGYEPLTVEEELQLLASVSSTNSK
ncbi:MAG: sugar nucleotide-binding protein, partial [Chitinophagales bacterium]|nr:sugar nucleotide-binding protein [Chitinophagales bacterium]